MSTSRVVEKWNKLSKHVEGAGTVDGASEIYCPGSRDVDV